MDGEEYRDNLRKPCREPSIIVDDGADLVAMVTGRCGSFSRRSGGSEETTSGVKRLKAMERGGSSPSP